MLVSSLCATNHTDFLSQTTLVYYVLVLEFWQVGEQNGKTGETKVFTAPLRPFPLVSESVPKIL